MFYCQQDIYHNIGDVNLFVYVGKAVVTRRLCILQAKIVKVQLWKMRSRDKLKSFKEDINRREA